MPRNYPLLSSFHIHPVIVLSNRYLYCSPKKRPYYKRVLSFLKGKFEGADAPSKIASRSCLTTWGRFYAVDILRSSKTVKKLSETTFDKLN
jgi:hypothetical protein